MHVYIDDKVVCLAEVPYFLGVNESALLLYVIVILLYSCSCQILPMKIFLNRSTGFIMTKITT